MLSSRFYRPAIAALTIKEKKFLGDKKDSGIEYEMPERMTTRIKADEGTMMGGKYQITYSFSNAIRKNVFRTISGKRRQYGMPGISFRLLYDFLCRNFNDGDYFIDEYFKQVFKSRSVYDRFENLNDEVSDQIMRETLDVYEALPKKKAGTPDMRYTTSKQYMRSLKVWTQPILKRLASRVADDIKHDIKVCLSTGQIPLRKQAVSEKTMKEREKFGIMHPYQFFFATGQLIDHLNIFVAFKGEESG